MTTKVRIEKADGHPMPVMVQVQVVNAEGKWVPEGQPRSLDRAAELLEDHIHQNKRLVVYELSTGAA